MKPFPYDKFYPIFMKELKSVFFHFIEQNKGKKPYIFVLKAPDYIAVNHPKSYCLGANGNTVVDFESTGRESAAELKSDLRNMIAEMEADSDFQTDNELQDIVANLRKKINSDQIPPLCILSFYSLIPGFVRRTDGVIPVHSYVYSPLNKAFERVCGYVDLFFQYRYLVFCDTAYDVIYEFSSVLPAYTYPDARKPVGSQLTDD